MNIGIIGAGNMGAALGKLWAKAGHQVIFSYSRDEDKLVRLLPQQVQRQKPELFKRQ